MNILGTQNARKDVLANRVNSLFVTFFLNQIITRKVQMVAFIPVPLKFFLMPLTMHFASSCQHLSLDVKYKA